MAAFTAEDPTDQLAFQTHWNRITADDSVIIRTILFDNQVVGNVLSYVQKGDREFSYWIGKQFWGKGIGTQALTLYLNLVKQRPLWARVVKDNFASLKILQNNGFKITETDTGFSNARNQVVEEYILKLG
ncbi:MAG: GNAT family N-acetyltransferase [Anaerolineae bacterium]